MVQYSPKRKTGRWLAQPTNENGVRVSRRFDYREDAEEYEASVRRTRKRVRAGLERPQSKVLFFDFAAAWLNNRINVLKMPHSTTASDESKLRRVWLPRLGARLMSNISQQEIEEILHELVTTGIEYKAADTCEPARPISAATRNRHRALLHTLFEDARKAGKAGANPVSDIVILSEQKKTRATGHWRADQVEIYNTAMFRKGFVYGVFAELQAFTGSRVGQTLGLQFDDIDEEFEVLHCRRIVEINTNQVFDRTKGQGDGGSYAMPLFERLKATLRQWRKFTHFAKGEDFILTGPDGKRLTYWHLEKVHAKVIKETGLPRITIHDLRRTFATMAELAGFSKSEVQKMLGHKSIKTTEIYTVPSLRDIGKKARERKFGAVTERIDGWSKEGATA